MGVSRRFLGVLFVSLITLCAGCQGEGLDDARGEQLLQSGREDLGQLTTARGGNVLYGQWSASGGQNPSSLANRQFLVEYTGAPGVVTFDLETSAGPYLYLLDAATGQVLVEKDNGGGGTHARISYDLNPGSYNRDLLLAALRQPERHGVGVSLGVSH